MRLEEDPIWQMVHTKEQTEGVPDMPWVDKNPEKLLEDGEIEDDYNEDLDGEDRKLDEKNPRSP